MFLFWDSVCLPATLVGDRSQLYGCCVHTEPAGISSTHSWAFIGRRLGGRFPLELGILSRCCSLMKSFYSLMGLCNVQNHRLLMTSLCWSLIINEIKSKQYSLTACFRVSPRRLHVHVSSARLSYLSKYPHINMEDQSCRSQNKGRIKTSKYLKQTSVQTDINQYLWCNCFLCDLYLNYINLLYLLLHLFFSFPINFGLTYFQRFS